MLWPEIVFAGTQRLLGWCCGRALTCSSDCRLSGSGNLENSQQYTTFAVVTICMVFLTRTQVSKTRVVTAAHARDGRWARKSLKIGPSRSHHQRSLHGGGIPSRTPKSHGCIGIPDTRETPGVIRPLRQVDCHSPSVKTSRNSVHFSQPSQRLWD
jgi:hypothetical protein